ncbi:hypothetical protein [Vagococcus fluvialis]|uniref:hypothetical protein n=1 Tax=Vagococcus fluvialis TaxID=2738 RepID=UPI001D0B1D89|nr:hypothetical protein [Vagococcus fluvialis]UDM72629.1 hypothetical protein K5L00_14675 [Vagococcus fluvialis]UDM78352.1 hypothetical protein K5K98_14880 [Vagococcus fluvialis]UDM83904.1 hypothetical protein K5K96_14700 [Vagococcus fluvialis]
MNIAIRQNEERTVVSVEFNVDVEEYVESFEEEMRRDYGEKRCHIEEEHNSDSVTYKLYEYGNYEHLKDSITIISEVSM